MTISRFQPPAEPGPIAPYTAGMRTLSIETPTHGRILIEDAASLSPSVALVGFHGYGQGADDILDEMRRLPGSPAWTLIAVQALHRFYSRDNRSVVASWMTSQDRDAMIADNLAYVKRVVEQAAASRVVFLGFSQGAAMAYRAGVLGSRPATGIIAVGGDVPPDTKGVAADRWPRVFVAAGTTDHWYAADKVDADERFLREHGVTHEVLRYDAGHVFTDEVRAAIGAFIAST